MGSKMTIHANFTGVNPITSRYDETDVGRRREEKDIEKKVNGLVRTHRINACGNSGYNIINGANQKNIEEMIPSGH